MNPINLLTSLILVLLSFEWSSAATAACPNCTRLLSDDYNYRKSIIGTLLAPNGSKTVITAGLGSLAQYVTDSSDKGTFASLINEIEMDIVHNADLTNQTKLERIGLKLDQLFINNPAIENAIRYQVIPGWGLLCDFLYMIDEMNIDKFWHLSTTTGATTPCLLYDLILDAAKANRVVEWFLCLDDIPCTMSRLMVTNILNLHHDIPSVPQQLYLKSLELRGYEMTVNQVQRIARSYYSSSAISCRRLIDTLANYKAAKLDPFANGQLKTIVGKTAAALAPPKTTQYCIDWLSNKIVLESNGSSPLVGSCNRIFWNQPYGSFYDNLIYNDCQISVLKEKAPNLYN